MSLVIKAADLQDFRRNVASNFEDLTQHARAYLDKVREQAAAILASAANEAQAIRQSAEIAGRKCAEEAIDALLEAKLARQLETLMPALRTAIDDVERGRQVWLTHWERRAVHLASAIAARIVRRELSRHPEITLDLIKEALELAAGSAEVRVLLNPSDYASLRAQVEKLAAEFSRLAPAEVAADANVTPGGCRVETRFGSIDQQLEAQLARIEEELTW